MNSIPKFTRNLINTALIFLIILLISATSDFLRPIYDVILFLLGPFVLAIYIFYAIRPVREFIYKYTKKETLSAVIAFIFLILIFALVFFVTTNIIIKQLSSLLATIDFRDIQNWDTPDFLKQFSEVINLDEAFESATKWANNTIRNLPSHAMKFIGNIGSLGTALILILFGTFYLLKDESQLNDWLKSMKLGRDKNHYLATAHEIHETLRSYISAQILVALGVGLFMYLAYRILSLPYAFSLAVIALFFEFIPFIGPFLGAAPAVVIGLTQSFSTGLFVALAALICQQVESNILSPLFVGSKLDMHPFFVMIIVLISINLFGILGALVAVPLYMVIKLTVKGLLEVKKEKEERDPAASVYKIEKKEPEKF